ncbi:MAG: glycoside hydrolase family 172 protein [Armatimonadota bacterium]
MIHPDELYKLPSNVFTRWASPENYDALPGQAAKTNFGRKGSSCRPVAADETFVMAHAEEPGTIRRIWITIRDRGPHMLRGLVIRAYWEGESKPAVEAPIGDFFCQAHGKMVPFQNAWFDNPEGRSFNCRIPMPFRKCFTLTVTNESPVDLGMFFYDVNFTLGDEHDSDVGYFHAHFRRENPTKMRKDFEILPHVEGRGRFLGCCLGVIADKERWGNSWWGEGEVKIYLDGDTYYPSLAGTGTEDYVGTGWGLGAFCTPWHGCVLADSDNMRYSFYRLHGPDPVYFHSDIRGTIQQMGCFGKEEMLAHMRTKGLKELVAWGDGTGRITPEDIEKMDYHCGFSEREDDWCATAYFYLNEPANNLPGIQAYEDRISGLLD